LAEAAHTGGSLVRTLRDRRAAAAATGPVFHGLRGGTGTLIDALVDALRERGAVLVTEAEVRELRSEDDGSTVVVTAARTFSARGVVLAVPADVAANLIEPTCPDAAEDLGRIEYTSVTLVTFVFRRDDVPGPLDGSGFLVPRDAGLFLTAASWGSSKWAHWDDGRHVILRVSAGHSGDRRVEQLDDDDVARRLLADLRTTMGIDASPVTIRVSPWPRGFAQYHVGHLDRVDRIEQALARDLPQVRVTGAAYRGLGIPACITQGRRAARDLLATPLG
jgi:oxygen-dependent protoporphyrinogen oxidase